MTKLEFVLSQLKWNKIFMTQYDKYIGVDQFNNQDEEIINLTEEVHNNENTDSSRHAE